MLILNPDLINSCRVCRGPNQDGDYQCLFVTSSNQVGDYTELSEAGILYEKLLDICLNERNYYPQYLCNSCDLQMKLFMKLKDKALKTVEYLQGIYGDVIINKAVAIENETFNCQSNEQINSSNESQSCQAMLDEYQLKYEVYQENQVPEYLHTIAVEFDTNEDSEDVYRNKNYNQENVDMDIELENFASNNSYSQILLEPECLYTEHQLSIPSKIESNFEEVIKEHIDFTKTQANENMLETISDENGSCIKLDPVLDKNDYVTEIYERIDDECIEKESNLENHTTIEDIIDDECSEKESNLENPQTIEDIIEFETYTEVNVETGSTYNDTEYLLEEENCNSQDKANQIRSNFSNAVKRSRTNKEYKQNRRYKCSACQLEFKNLQEYKLHRIDVHNENFTCNVCSKEFRTIATLENHIKTLHSNEPAFQCEICYKSFNQKGHYQYHMNFHNNVRNFKCEICEKAFIAKADLKTHLRLHTGERPYVCNICGKDYLMTEHLTAHMITHTEKLFPCSVCHKKFTTHKTLRLHVRTIHEDAPRFKCTVCLKAFRRKHHLEYHLKSHQTGVKNLEIRHRKINESDIMEDLGEESIDDPSFIYLA